MPMKIMNGNPDTMIALLKLKVLHKKGAKGILGRGFCVKGNLRKGFFVHFVFAYFFTAHLVIVSIHLNNGFLQFRYFMHRLKHPFISKVL